MKAGIFAAGMGSRFLAAGCREPKPLIPLLGHVLENLRASLEKTLESLRSRWVDQAVLQEHVHGDLIKFYGVLPQKWFRHFYHRPEEAKGFSFSPEKLRATAETAASRLGLAAEEIAGCLLRRRQKSESGYGLLWRSA